MLARPWLEQLRGELTRRKLPPPYVERLMSELSDHVSDSLEDPMSTDAKDFHALAHRLGSPQEVATAAATEYRRTHFCGRHPILTFVLLPIVALPLLWASGMVVMLASAKAFGLETGGDGVGGAVWHWASVNAPLIVLGVLVLPIALAAAVFCRIASTAGVSWKWTLSACGILAAIGGAAMANVVLPGMAEKGMVTFGLGIGTHPSEAQLLQFALPLAIGAWAIWRQAAKHRDACAV